jgi:Ca-activated chloride channel family protein
MNALQAWFDALAWPWMLLALPLPLLARWLLPRRRSASAALRVPYGELIDKIAAAGAGHALRGRGPGVLALCAWIALCFAAARPQELGPPIAPPQVGRDLMLAVDLSGSMSEEDMTLGGQVVDRLTAAKAVLADFLDRRGGDRVGLLVFGQRAYTLTPLTLDLTSVRQQLQDSVVGLAGRETALGDALALSVKRLQSQPSDQRVVVLLTDGVNTAGVLDPGKAAELAHDANVRVHTIAFGGEGGLSVFGFRLPSPGGDQIDEAGLQRIAQATGGKFFRARDTESLAGIYAEIDRLEPIRRPGQAVRPRIERYPWPLGAALALAALAALPWRRRA